MGGRSFATGDRFVVQVGNIAHGGHFIAHKSGETIFVRGAITGETVEIRITGYRKKIYSAETVHVLMPSQNRQSPPCEVSQICGGCDFQHINLEYQRELKSQVLGDSLVRFSGLTQQEVNGLLVDGVLPVEESSLDGGNWRRRARFVWNDGWNMRRYRSHELVSTPNCTIITPEMRKTLRGIDGLDVGEYIVAEGLNGVTVSGANLHVAGPRKVTHSEFGVRWDVSPEGFWQAHPGLISGIAEFITNTFPIRSGELWWDLYGGAGVFAAFLSNQVGAEGRVVSVDGNSAAIKEARRALHERSNITLINSDVAEFLRTGLEGLITTPDGVILDPPRSGIGTALADSIVKRKPGKIIYIACDPVSLARDLKVLRSEYRVVQIRAWDAFPMSHHFETVAVLERDLS